MEKWPKGITLRIRKIPVQTPLCARPGFGTQPRYEALSDLWVKPNIKHSD